MGVYFCVSPTVLQTPSTPPQVLAASLGSHFLQIGTLEKDQAWCRLRNEDNATACVCVYSMCVCRDVNGGCSQNRFFQGQKLCACCRGHSLQDYTQIYLPILSLGCLCVYIYIMCIYRNCQRPTQKLNKDKVICWSLQTQVCDIFPWTASVTFTS